MISETLEWYIQIIKTNGEWVSAVGGIFYEKQKALETLNRVKKRFGKENFRLIERKTVDRVMEE